MQRWIRVLVLALVPLFATACVIIEDGEVGVSKSFGSIGDQPVPQGVTFVIPVVRQVETWNVKLQEFKEQATVPSSEGLIVGLDTSLLFQVEPASAPEIRKTVGTERVYYQTLILPYFRNSVRDIVAGYQVKNIYAEIGRAEIAAKMGAPVNTINTWISRGRKQLRQAVPGEAGLGGAVDVDGPVPVVGGGAAWATVAEPSAAAPASAATTARRECEPRGMGAIPSVGSDPPDARERA